MNLHLFIPALFWSDHAAPEIYHDMPMPALEALLSKSKQTVNPACDYNAWLCRSFNIKKQHDWPAAPIMLHADAAELAATSSKDFWLRADPVHLRVEQNHILLADNHIFEITDDEAIQFADVINQHLIDDDLTLLPLHPYRWYIRLKKNPEIKTHTLNSVTCKNINTLLPTGKESVKWHRIFNEIQMLLHEHPLNQARIARDQITINSIWFWGGGYLPQSIHSCYASIWSDEHLSQALAKLSGIPCHKLPNNTHHWLQTNRAENQLVILDTLLAKDQYNDAHHWRKSLKELERNWFAPLYEALKNNKIRELKISTINENSAYEFVITRKHLWKFWLTIKPLAYYAVKQ